MTSAPAPIRVAVVNDYDLVVRGLAAILESYADRVLVVELDSQRPVVSEVDIVLYDTFGQVQADRVELSDLVLTGGPRLVIYTWNVDADLVERAIEKGASGYVAKSLPTEELVAMLERVHAGEVVRPSDAGDVSDGLAGNWPGRSVGLSAREAEVVALITQGLTNDEIAARAYLSINTVKTYIRGAYRKMGVQRRPQAILWGIAHGFEPDSRRSLRDEPER